MDKITIEINGLTMRANHGVLPQERTVGNDFKIDLRLTYPAHRAVATDSLDATLNYAEVIQTVKRVMAQPSALLEHVCGRIRDELLRDFPLIEAGTVRVAKLSPPIGGVQLQSVAVELAW